MTEGQKVARLQEIKTKLANKLGMKEAQSLYEWFNVVKDVGCPNCGVDFSAQGPEYNIYPHWMGGCKL